MGNVSMDGISLLLAALAILVAILLWLFPPDPLRKLLKIERNSGVKLAPISNSIEVHKNILFEIGPNTSIELVKELFSSPHKIHNSTFPVFLENKVTTKVWSYSFSNVDIQIESDDGETVSVITIQLHRPSPGRVFDIPYSKPIGELTLQDVIEECASEKVKFFASMRDAYLAIECYKGRLGGYLTYTFGRYSPSELITAKIVNGKVVSRNGEELDLSTILVDFVSISNSEDRGHPIAYGS